MSTRSIKFVEGLQWPVEHLRDLPEDWEELYEAGHPISNRDGREVRLICKTYDCHYCGALWGIGNNWTPVLFAREGIKLAPLAVIDGRPVHIGDEIEMFYISSLGVFLRWIGEPYQIEVLA